MTRERYAVDRCIMTTHHGMFWLGVQECASLEDARILLDFTKRFSDKFVILVVLKEVNGEWEPVEVFNRHVFELKKRLH